MSAGCRCRPLYTCGPCYSVEQSIDTEQARRDDPGDPMIGADWDRAEGGELWNSYPGMPGW